MALRGFNWILGNSIYIYFIYRLLPKTTVMRLLRFAIIPLFAMGFMHFSLEASFKEGAAAQSPSIENSSEGDSEGAPSGDIDSKGAPSRFNPSQHDGPYIMYRNNQVFVHYIKPEGNQSKHQVDSFAATDRGKISLDVQTDEPGKTFKVKLQDKLVNEKTEYKKASRQFVISDIEGEFGAFRKLLQAGKVIDENFNWTYGDGHLLLVGDFVDRGTQVNEVLWLIYSLEEKARAAGGYVHYVLGNHEIMVMSGDHRYVNPKYAGSAASIGLHLMTLYGAESEIGRWLRTKNVVEKVDNIMYVHGGISRKVNRMELNLSTINELARPFYADTSYAYPDANTDTLYQDAGPFWYRGYYSGETATAAQVLDSTFYKFRAKKMVTGHTPVRDTISVWYGGRLYNVDTPHAKGKSEAMLVEGKSIWRVKPDGTRTPLD
jgi:hypothetical protein